MGNDICFVILHYGELDVTKKCVDSIMKLDNTSNFKIVLIDNDTKKSDKERDKLDLLFKEYECVHVLRMYGNTGFSRANNEGYKYVLENYKPEYIIVCNNDIEFKQSNTIDLIDKVYKETNFGLMGPDIIRAKDKVHQNPHEVNLSNRQQIEHSIKMNSFFLKHYDLLYPILYVYFNYQDKELKKISDKNLDNHDKRLEGVVLTGSFLVFSKEFFERRKECFYPETQFYCEEQILCYNCKKSGIKIIYDPSVYVYHESEASTRATYSSMKNRLKFRLKMSIESCKIYLNILKKDNNGI